MDRFLLISYFYKMKKYILFYFALVVNLQFIQAQPAIQWQKCLGGSLAEDAACIQQTNDGGYIVAASTFSVDGDVTFNNGYRDVWIVKVDSIGTILWEKCLGGSDDEWSITIRQMTDGSYLFAGSTASTNGDIFSNHGSTDYWVVKLDSSGFIQWERTYGGSEMDLLFSMELTNDGGCILVGASASSDGDLSGNQGFDDCWIVKLDSTGSIQWENSIGGSLFDVGHSAQQTSDGGYIIAASSESNDGDVSGNHGSIDVWIIKLDSIGALQWQKSFGGSNSDYSREIQITANSEFIVTGTSSSNDGDVSGNHGGPDFWIIKLSTLGVIQWQNSLGGSLEDQPLSLLQTADGGYALAGISKSNNGQVSGNHGDVDYWIVKVDANGSFQWQKCLGGSDYDGARSIQSTSDGGYIIVGASSSIDGDVTGNHGSRDCWLVKLSSTTMLNDIAQNKSDISISPNPFSGNTQVTFELTSTENVRIFVQDSKGSLIKNFNNTNLTIGENVLEWNGANNDGNIVSDGLYFISIESDLFKQSRKIILMKD